MGTIHQGTQVHRFHAQHNPEIGISLIFSNQTSWVKRSASTLRRGEKMGHKSGPWKPSLREFLLWLSALHPLEIGVGTIHQITQLRRRQSHFTNPEIGVSMIFSTNSLLEYYMNQNAPAKKRWTTNPDRGSPRPGNSFYGSLTIHRARLRATKTATMSLTVAPTGR